MASFTSRFNRRTRKPPGCDTSTGNVWWLGITRKALDLRRRGLEIETVQLGTVNGELLTANEGFWTANGELEIAVEELEAGRAVLRKGYRGGMHGSGVWRDD